MLSHIDSEYYCFKEKAQCSGPVSGSPWARMHAATPRRRRCRAGGRLTTVGINSPIPDALRPTGIFIREILFIMSVNDKNKLHLWLE